MTIWEIAAGVCLGKVLYDLTGVIASAIYVAGFAVVRNCQGRL